MRRITQLFVILFFFLLALPKLQRICHWFPRITLGGVERQMDKPRLTPQTWWDGSFQAAWEAYFNWRFSLRSHAVLTWNHLNFSAFRQLPPHRGTQLVVGKNGWLYDKAYIDAHNQDKRADPATMRASVARTLELQQRLAARGIGFLLVIAPSKAAIYPEFVPGGMLKTEPAAGPSDYERILPLLQAAGVQTLDAVSVFHALKGTSPHPLFSKTGTHWNYFGAGLIASNMLERLGRQTGRAFANVYMTGVRYDEWAEGTDNDLGEMLNMWNVPAFGKDGRSGSEQLHPDFFPMTGANLVHPDILFVGDSFVHTLTEVLDRQGICRQRDTLFYFRRRYRFPLDNPKNIARYQYEEVNSAPFDPLQWDGLAELKGRDAVVIEINQIWLPYIGYGFVERALAALAAAEASETAEAAAR